MSAQSHPLLRKPGASMTPRPQSRVSIMYHRPCIKAKHPATYSIKTLSCLCLPRSTMRSARAALFINHFSINATTGRSHRPHNLISAFLSTTSARSLIPHSRSRNIIMPLTWGNCHTNTSLVSSSAGAKVPFIKLMILSSTIPFLSTTVAVQTAVSIILPFDVRLLTASSFSHGFISQRDDTRGRV
jgi:hypothetical protein